MTKLNDVETIVAKESDMRTGALMLGVGRRMQSKFWGYTILHNMLGQQLARKRRSNQITKNDKRCNLLKSVFKESSTKTTKTNKHLKAKKRRKLHF
jgi:hypothetical protein